MIRSVFPAAIIPGECHSCLKLRKHQTCFFLLFQIIFASSCDLRLPTKMPYNRGHDNLKKLVKADHVLAEIAGKEMATRSEFVKLLWKYIKSNNLQDPTNGRFIYLDTRLAQLMGGKKSQRTNAYKMLRHIEAHLIKTAASGNQAELPAAAVRAEVEKSQDPSNP